MKRNRRSSTLITASSAYYAPVKPPFGKTGDGKERELGVITWERCECGNRIAPYVRDLDDPDPAVKRKCVNCLIQGGRLETERR
jgi:hypothetical protein